MRKITIILNFLMFSMSAFSAGPKQSKEPIAHMQVNNCVRDSKKSPKRTVCIAFAIKEPNLRLVQVSSLLSIENTYYQLTPFFKDSGVKRHMFNATKIPKPQGTIPDLLIDAVSRAKTEACNHTDSCTIWRLEADKSLTLVSARKIETYQDDSKKATTEAQKLKTQRKP